MTFGTRDFAYEYCRIRPSIARAATESIGEFDSGGEP
jgi:hypothetical protein